jgi:hypothetical protein
MPRVKLEIFRGPYLPALARGFQVESCRLLTDVSLRCDSGWTSYRPAIVDTGAPVSLFPRPVWQQADIRRLGRVSVGGLMRRSECMLETTLAIVTMAIRDQEHEIGPIETHALLADTDDVPTLLGMRGVLAELTLHVSASCNQAYVETLIPDP